MRTVEHSTEIEFEPGDPTFDAVGLEHRRIDLTDVTASAPGDDHIGRPSRVQPGRTRRRQLHIRQGERPVQRIEYGNRSRRLFTGDGDRKVLALIRKDLPLSSGQEHVVDLEEPHIGVAMRLVVRNGLQLPGKQRGAQDRLLGMERIGEGHPVLGKTRLGEIAGGEERHR